jgi:hypothetical protein
MKKTLSLLLGFIPFASFAHEGHGHTEGFTITHYFVEPQHAITILAVAVVMYLFYKNIMRKANQA